MRRVDLFARLDEWWRQPARYDWLVSFVEARGYGLLTRLGVAAACLAIGLWSLLMVFSPQGVTGPWAEAVSVACGIVGIVASVCYAVRWPTYRQSKAIVVVLNASIAANCMLYLAQDKSAVGILAFALTAGYVACLHTPPYLASLLATAMTIMGLNLVQISLRGDPAAGFADGLLRLAAITVVPMTIQMLVQLLGEKAVVSDIDPLTNLANRRGLDRAVHCLVTPAMAVRQTEVVITMLDIDKFKAINDTFGHATGDSVLVTLSDILRRVCSANAAIARIGGEEFAIVSLDDVDAATEIAERLRAELAATPWALTASFGIASKTVPRNATIDTAQLTNQLLRAADHAMYVAKRTGGDHVRLAS